MLFSDQWPAATYERRQELWQLHQEYTLQFMWFLQHDDALPLQVTPTLHKHCAALTTSRASDEILLFLVFIADRLQLKQEALSWGLAADEFKVC